MSASHPGAHPDQPSAAPRIAVQLVAGLPGPARAAVLATALERLPGPVTLLLEGLPADGTAEVPLQPGRTVHGLAPGCLCCIGQLTLRVTLARAVRLERPAAIVIALADPAHVPGLRTLLEAPPWQTLLQVRAGHLQV